jgi:hypothetical protein
MSDQNVPDGKGDGAGPSGDLGEDASPEQLVERGDVMRLLRDTRRRPQAYGRGADVRALRQALAAAADSNFDGHLQPLYALMIGFTTDLLVMSQCAALRQLECVQEDAPRRSAESIAGRLNSILPQVERLHYHLIELTRAYATTKHTLSIGRKRVGDNAKQRDARAIAEDTEALLLTEGWFEPYG